MIRPMPLDATLLAPALPVWPGDAAAAWQQASSRHFVVHGNEAPKDVRAYTARLERFDRAVRALRGIPEDRRGPTLRVTVHVLDSVE